MYCLEAKVPRSLSHCMMAGDWPVPTPSDTIYEAFGSLAQVFPTTVLQNTLVPVLPILSLLSPLPHQCWSPHSLSVISLWLTLSRLVLTAG